MATTKRRNDFVNTDEGIAVKQQLLAIAENETYNTGSSYSTDADLYPDNQIPFVDKHMNYLINHPQLDAQKYLANVKLMSRIRR